MKDLTQLLSYIKAEKNEKIEFRDQRRKMVLTLYGLDTTKTSYSR